MKIIKLIRYFIKTEITFAIEFFIWLTLVRDWDLYVHFITLDPDPFGLKYGVRFLWAVLPVIFAYMEYKSNERKINNLF